MIKYGQNMLLFHFQRKLISFSIANISDMNIIDAYETIGHIIISENIQNTHYEIFEPYIQNFHIVLGHDSNIYIGTITIN